MTRLIVLGLLTLSLSGCGVIVTQKTPYFFQKSATGDYELRLNVERRNTTVTIQDVDAVVDGQAHAMTSAGGGDWTYRHQTPAVTGLNVSYAVAYRELSTFLIPTTATARRPGGTGSYQIPILDRDSDIDGDGIVDRLDPCPFAAAAPCSVTDANAGNVRFTQSNSTQFVTTMRDNLGNAVVTMARGTYHAFRHLVRARAQVTSWSISGANATGKTIEFEDCDLVFQDAALGFQNTFVQVFAANGARTCGFSIQSGGQRLAEGHEVVIVVVTDTAGTNVGRGRVAARVTLKPPASTAPAEAVALFDQMTGNAPARYVYVFQPDLDTTADLVNAPRATTTHADFFADGFMLFRR